MCNRNFALLPWLAAAMIAAGCGDESNEPPPSDPFNFLVWANVPAADNDTNLVIPVAELPTSGELSFDDGIVFSTPIDVHAFNGSVYISDAGPQNLTKYGVVDNELQVDRRLSFADRGGVNYFFFLDENRAFTVNRPQLELIEFNPSTMTITGTIDLGLIDRNDIDHEVRRGFLRAADNTLFLYVAYNTMRQVFDNTLVVAVIDLDAGTVTLERQEACPAAAGFGGFFGDDGSLYLMGDSFGGFTLLLPDPSQVKPNCVVRIPPDSRTFDPDYLFRPSGLLEGSEAWGLFEVRDGVAVTNGINLPRIGEFDSPIEFLGAPIHEGWSVDVRDQTAERIDTLPPGGIGISSFTVGSQLLIPRITGEIDDAGNITSATTQVYGYDGTTATTLFTLGGFLNNVLEF